MMRYALFLGCKIPSCVPQYEFAARRVLKALDIKLVDMPFNCCGYPMRDQYFESYLLAAAKNLALAESKGQNIVTLCKCCLGSLKRAQNFLASHRNLFTLVNDVLSREGLVYTGACQVNHLQSVLYHQVGLERLSEMIVRPFSGLKVAAMYGCHALRPSRITGFDRPYDPHIIDDLIGVTGAVSVPWEGRLKCCGAPLREKNPELSLSTISERLRECRDSEADVLNVDCPHTLLQVKRAFETLGPQTLASVRGVALYPQMLGLALGMDPSELGLEDNRPRSGCVANYLAPLGAASQEGDSAASGAGNSPS
jgi:heterodisulfide reductase subunit B